MVFIQGGLWKKRYQVRFCEFLLWRSLQKSCERSHWQVLCRSCCARSLCRAICTKCYMISPQKISVRDLKVRSLLKLAAALINKLFTLPSDTPFVSLPRRLRKVLLGWHATEALNLNIEGVQCTAPAAMMWPASATDLYRMLTETRVILKQSLQIFTWEILGSPLVTKI